MMDVTDTDGEWNHYKNGIFTQTSDTHIALTSARNIGENTYILFNTEEFDELISSVENYEDTKNSYEIGYVANVARIYHPVDDEHIVSVQEDTLKSLRELWHDNYDVGEDDFVEYCRGVFGESSLRKVIESESTWYGGEYDAVLVKKNRLLNKTAAMKIRECDDIGIGTSYIFEDDESENTLWKHQLYIGLIDMRDE